MNGLLCLILININTLLHAVCCAPIPTHSHSHSPLCPHAYSFTVCCAPIFTILYSLLSTIPTLVQSAVPPFLGHGLIQLPSRISGHPRPHRTPDPKDPSSRLIKETRSPKLVTARGKGAPTSEVSEFEAENMPSLRQLKATTTNVMPFLGHVKNMNRSPFTLSALKATMQRVASFMQEATS